MRRDTSIGWMLLLLWATATISGGCASTATSARDANNRLTALRSQRSARPTDSRMAERHFVDGSLLGMCDKHAEAIAEYRRALQFDSTNGAIYYAIGRSYRELNEVDSAIHYTRMAARYRALPSVHEQLADLLMNSGDFDGAIVHLDSIVVRDPDNLQSRYTLGRLLQERDAARSIAHFEYILRNLADDSDVMLRLAELYLDRNDVDAALEMMRRMIAVEPTNAELRQMTTTILLDAGRYSEAMQVLHDSQEQIPIRDDVDRYLLETLREVRERIDDARTPPDSLVAFARDLVTHTSARSESSQARVSAGVLALQVGQDAQAEALFARALIDSSTDAQLWAHVASAYLIAEEAETGLRLVVNHAHRYHGDYRVPYLVGLLNVAAGKTDSAVQWLTRSIEINDENADAWAALGKLYDGFGEPVPSDAAYEKSIALRADASVLDNFARALARRGVRLEHALDLISTALSKEPENESFLDTRGWILYQLGELDAALADLNRAAAAGGTQADVFEHIGDVRRARGETEAARDAYDRALRINPGSLGVREKLRDLE